MIFSPSPVDKVPPYALAMTSFTHTISLVVSSVNIASDACYNHPVV